MNFRTLGKTGVRLSEVGLGTWQLGGGDWGELSGDAASRILHAATEQGINFFDTADVYGLGRSESLIGRFLRETEETVYVATKLGRRVWVQEGWPERFTLEAVRRETQRSLERLGGETIFLQQWHCIPTAMLRDGEALDHLETLKKEGLIQHWGCSVESVEEALLCLRHPGCASLQVIFNIFRQKLVEEFLPLCREKNVGVLARVPLASGLLTGKFHPGHQFAAADHRRYNADGQAFNVGETFAGLPFGQGVELAQRVGQMLPGADPSRRAQQALRWILDHEGICSVIPGATDPSHVQSNAAASALPPLGEGVHRSLREFYEREVAAAIRGPY